MKLYNCPYKGDMCFLYGNCEECAFYKSMEKNRNYRKTIKNIKKENAELQKQVVELKEWCDTTYKKAVEREEDAYSLGFDKGKVQAVKDTAREILDELDLFFKGTTFRKGYEFKKIDQKLKEIAKQKGVEVE